VGALLHSAHISAGEWIKLITVPFFTGAIGWLINWTGLIMLFNPVHFHGFRVPGLYELSRLLPRRLQEIPGIMQGGIGWQGIVPARAAKMGSISVDKAIAKLGTPSEFFQELGPEQIAEQMTIMFEPLIPEIVGKIMEREQPALWRNLPPQAKEALFSRVRQQLPAIMSDITDTIALYIDQLIDPKLMVIDHFEQNPALVNKIFKDFGARELRLMVNFGFLFGFLLGIPVAVVTHFVTNWWLLPLLGIVVGWFTNLLGMWVIFEPVEPRKIGPFRLHGLFLRRQPQAADVYARIIAEDVVTLENFGNALFYGPRGDRSMQMLEEAMRPAIDRAAGPIRAAVRVAVGAREYDTLTQAFARESTEHTMTPFMDTDFGRQQSENIRTLFAARVKELPSRDYVEMLRSAIKEDEWMLYLHGGAMGLAGGLVHLGIFG
jgi:uncharacterized membrane protein YheB (UPF0754 family)